MNLFPNIRQLVGIAERDKGDKDEGEESAHGESEVSRSDFTAWDNHDLKCALRVR